MLLRWVGFLVLVVVLHSVLSALPVLGPLLGRFGIFGFWISAILTGFLLRWLARRVVDHQRFGAQVRELETVDSPHNRGKLGSLMAKAGRPRRALPFLREAHAGEPDSAEWAFQLGRAALQVGEYEEAGEALARCVELNEEHAYGQALLRLVEVRVREQRYEEALAGLDRFDRNHGENPESAYRRGVVLGRLDRKDEAKAALARVGELARSVPKYQRNEARSWVLRAYFAKV